jgi:tight adherence protein B
MNVALSASHLNAVALMLGALVAGLAALWLIDALSGAGPRARLNQRLAEVMSRVSARIAEDDAPGGRALFLAQRRGLRGRLAAWLADLSVAIGGAGPFRTLMIVTFALAALGAVGASALVGLPAPVAALAGGAVGVLAFRMTRAEMRRRWALAFLEKMVEAVELLARSVRSGFTPGAAIRIVSREIGPPVGPVFARIADEDELGLDLRVSLRRAARRIGLSDFNFLAVALIMQRETGGQLADTLDNLHLMLRKRREARLRIAALTSQGRTSALILGILPFVAGAGVAMTAPDQFALLFTPGLGQTLVTVGLGLLIVGALVMRWMVTPRP